MYNFPLDYPALERILVVRMDNIGDVVLTSPFLRALRKTYPTARISLLASPAGSKVAPLLPWVDDCILWRGVWQEIHPQANHQPTMDEELVSTLRLGKFSAAFILTSFVQSPYPPASIAYRALIPVRVGQSREFGGRLLTHWVHPLPDHAHQAERNLHLLDELGISRQGADLELVIPPHVQEAADRLLHEVNIDPIKPYIVLAPGASCESRQYDPVRFRQAAWLLARDRVDLPVVILGHQREAGVNGYMGPFKGSGSRVVSLVGLTSVPEFAAIIRRARLVICNNSSALHFADAFRVPIVVLYSGTEGLGQWAPRESQAALLYRPVPCSPCYQFKCPYGKECLDISPDEVVMRAQSLLWDQKVSTGEHSGAIAPNSSGR